MEEIEKALSFFRDSCIPSEIKLHFSKCMNGIEKAAYFDKDLMYIYVYESSDDPHSVNSETICCWEALKNQSDENGKRVKSIIVNNFGIKSYYHFIISIVQCIQNLPH